MKSGWGRDGLVVLVNRAVPVLVDEDDVAGHGTRLGGVGGGLLVRLENAGRLVAIEDGHRQADVGVGDEVVARAEHAARGERLAALAEAGDLVADHADVAVDVVLPIAFLTAVGEGELDALVAGAGHVGGGRREADHTRDGHDGEHVVGVLHEVVENHVKRPP